MKSKKRNINILVIFIILAIILLIIYIIIHNRNKKSNPKTNYSENSTWDWLVLIPKDPDAISIGFTPTKDVNGNLDLVDSKKNLTYSEMDGLIIEYDRETYGPIVGGKNILDYDINIPDEYLNNVGLTREQFSSNSSAIAITNRLSSENSVPGNIPYPGKDLTMYVLNKITGQMNSYNISRRVTRNQDVSIDYNTGDIILKPIITNTEFNNYDIQNCIYNRDISALVTFYSSEKSEWSWIVFVPTDTTYISIGFTPNKDNIGNLDLVDSKKNLIDSEMDDPIVGGKNILDKNINITDEYLKSVGLTREQFSSNSSIIAISNKVSPQNPVKGNIPYPGKDLTMYVLNKITGQMNSYNISRSVTITPAPNYSYNISYIILNHVIENTTFNFVIQNCAYDKNIPALVIF